MTDRSGKGTGERRKKRIPKGRPIHGYVIVPSVLAVLVAVAFFTPQAIFRVQDAILCRNMNLSRQESLNVEALSTSYERLLTERMTNYAEGVARDEDFYVASQNLSMNEELNDYLYSDTGLYGEFISDFINANLLPSGLWELEYSVSQWKQYVIYSDNFTNGVNFILWYIELQDAEGKIFKLLADAEDGTIYAVKTEGSGVNPNEKTRKERNHYAEYIFQDEIATRVWGFCATYYGALDEETQKEFQILMEMGWTAAILGGEEVSSEMDAIYDERTMVMEAQNNHGRWKDIREMIVYKMDGEHRIDFSLPYGDFTIDAVLEIAEQDGMVWDMYGCPYLTTGIRQIYEMIPEFA